MRQYYPSQIIGDILLVNGTSKRSKINRTGQSIKSASKASYSHVAFCLGVGEFIHADTDSGVDLIFVDDLLSKYDGEWRAIRNKEIFKIASKNDVRIYNTAIFYLSQAYNIKFKGVFSGKDSTESAICSSLIARIYNEIGIDFGRKPSKTLPVHFEEYFTHPEWDDVTEEHKVAIKAILKCPDIKNDFFERRDRSLAMQQTLINHVEQYHMIDDLLKAHHNLMNSLGLKPGPYTKTPYNEIPIKHWNVKQPGNENE